MNFEVFMEMMTERRRKEGGQTQKANDLALAWAPRRDATDGRMSQEKRRNMVRTFQTGGRGNFEERREGEEACCAYKQ